MKPGEEYEIRPLQLRLLEVLKEVHSALKSAGLRYYMVDGTLLGAVREKGFIAWDDDIDIAMPRPDYERLIKEREKILPKHLEFVSFETDSSYPLHFGKIQDARTTLIERPHLFYLGGIYVDVFPIDGAPKGKIAQRFYDARYKYLKKMLYFLCRDPYRHGHGVSSWIPLLARKMYTLQGLQSKIKRWMMKHPFETSKLAAVNHNDGLGSMVDKEKVLGDPQPVLFEDFDANGMKNNEAYLSQLFGDWQTPPPSGKRHQHRFWYMDLDRPYREFDKSLLTGE
ncbi:MAG: LicD family protein [Prevotella sp.]|nr:LicD family protein [Bacteroides sp.]MCM1366042.1 LicD family protein [Prevotella sp.]MCM1436888.1 LicD family protein [Prevotella sp.]